MTAPPAGRRRRLRRAAFALLPLGLLVVAAEVVARVAVWRGEKSLYARDPWREHVLLPGQEYVADGYWGSMRVRVNALGHRGPELAAQKPPGGLRVVCMGGSQTFGFGSSSDATSWPGVLATRLRAASPQRPVEVLDAGIPGWNVRTALTDWQLQLRPLGFDVAVICEAYNDLQETASARYQAASHAREPDELLAQRGLLTRALGASEAWRWLITKVTEKRIKHMKLPAPLPAGEEAYARNLRAAVAALRAAGTRVVLCTYPHMFHMDEAALRQELGEKRLDSTMRRCPFTYEGVRLGLQRYNERVREVARSEGVTLCDLERRIPARAELWVDPIHLSDAGAALVGEAVAEALAGP